MIGLAYKKISDRMSLKQAGGVAYGEIGGFMTTLSEGMGNKDIFISLCIPDDEILEIIVAALNSKERQKMFRIRAYTVKDRFVLVSFLDNPGTMKRINAFIGWFYPFLKEAGALGSNYCPDCKQPLSDDEKVCKFINNKVHVLHAGCASKIQFEFNVHNEMCENEKPNYGRGIIGAFIGGIVGAVPWAIVYALGYFVGWLGFLIGFAAQKGYTLFGGKIKKPTMAILGVTIIFSVLFGQLLGDCLSIGYLIINGELPLFKLTDIPTLIYLMFISDSEYKNGFLLNVVMGLVFAGLGVASLFKNLSGQISEQEPTITDIPEKK